MIKETLSSMYGHMRDYMYDFRDCGVPPKVYGMSKRRNRFKKLYVVAKKK